MSNIIQATNLTLTYDNGLSEIIKDVVDYKGEIIWDSTKPDGTPRKLLDVSRMKAKGWESGISLKDGIRKTYEWYIEMFCKSSI